MKNFDPKYNNIPKTEIHCHLEGAIRTQTIIDVAKEYGLKLPSYEVDELDKYVKVYDQMQSLGAFRRFGQAKHQTLRSPLLARLGLSRTRLGLGCLSRGSSACQGARRKR